MCVVPSRFANAFARHRSSTPRSLHFLGKRHVVPVRRRMFLGGPAACACNMEHRSTVLDRREDRGATEVRLDGLSLIADLSILSTSFAC